MREPSRRSSLAIPPCLCYLDRSQVAQESPPAASWPTARVNWPRELAGIRVTDSQYTKIAAEALLDSSPPFLVNHAMRTFYFGASIPRH